MESSGNTVIIQCMNSEKIGSPDVGSSLCKEQFVPIYGNL